MAQLTIDQAMQIAGEHHKAWRLEQAEAIYRQVLAHQPAHFLAQYNLGIALQRQWKMEGAIIALARAIQLDPNFALAHINLGRALRDIGKLDEAMVELARGVELAPQSAFAHHSLGRCYLDQGMLDEALACSDRAIALAPADPGVHSSRVFTLHFHPRFTAQEILREHQLWNQRHARPLADQIRPHANDPSPERRLKVGYVSPDFRQHPVGKFMQPLLANHDHAAFEIVCYSSGRWSDALTASLRAAADAWRDMLGVPDAQLAEMIREDGIDILVDLTMHMADSRLLVFARKPAPVQVTYLAYPATTGVEAIDYRITDNYLDPPGASDADYVEKSIRLPDYFGCYDPQAMAAAAHEVAPLPALRHGYVTFGCLNNFIKVNDGVLRAWAKVLAAVPQSQLLVHAEPGSHLSRITSIFAEHGVEAARLRCMPRRPWEEYFQMYHQIDIGLDTFPYNGHTTSMDSMWMGVPVVTLVGRTAVGRAGWSQLSNLGLTELAAETEERFVQIAVELANDLPRLAHLRSTLRERMLKSPLTDSKRFARSIEAAYRQMWREWCETRDHQPAIERRD